MTTTVNTIKEILDQKKEVLLAQLTKEIVGEPQPQQTEAPASEE